MSDLAGTNNLPILRRKTEPEGRTLEMELRLCPEPTFNEEEVMTAPPHWELRDKSKEDPLAWGPLDTYPMMQRLFALSMIALQMIPVEQIEQQLRSMQIGAPKVVKANQ